MAAGLDRGDVEETKPTGELQTEEISPAKPLTPDEQASLDQTEASLREGETATDPQEQANRTQASPLSSGIDAATSAKSTASKAKRVGMLAAFGGLGFILIGIVVAIILFLLGFKLDHIKNLFIDYQFAGYHRSISKRINHIVTTEAILSGESTGKLPAAGKASLYEKLRGYNANKALQALGKEGFKLDFEKKSLGRQGKLQGFTDSLTGKNYWREGTPGAKSGPNDVILKESSFLKQLNTSIDAHLPNESNFFRRRTVSDVYQRSGIKLIKFKLLMEKIKAKGSGKITPQEAGEATRTEQLDATRPTTTNNAVIKDEAEQARERAIKGEPQTVEVGTVPERLSKLKTLGEFSQIAFWVTLYCIATDIRDSIPEALSSKVDNAMAGAMDTNTKADMQREGKAPLEGISATSKQFDGFEKSAAYQRAMGLPVTGKDLDPQDYPTTVLGFKPDQIKPYTEAFDQAFSGPACKIPVLNGVCNSVRSNACSQILNPYVQGSMAAIETVIAVMSLGSETAAAQAAGRSASYALGKGVAKLVAGVGVSVYVFGHLIPSMVQDVSGVSAAGLTNAVDKANRHDAGMNLLKNEIASTSGAYPISNETAMDQTRLARSERATADKEKGPMYALFNLNNTYSVASTALATVPTSVNSALSSFSGSVAAVFQPAGFLKLFAGTANAGVTPSGDAAFYGIQQYGWDDKILDGTNPAYNYINNQAYIEGSDMGLEGFKTKYAKCLGAKADVRLLGSDPNDPSFDYSKCNGYTQTEEYIHYGVYVLDCFSTEQLIATNNDKDIFHESDCSSLIGATDSPSIPGAPDPGGSTVPPGNGIVAGNIVQTAIGLAWPDDSLDGKTMTNASPAFKAAVDPSVEPTDEFGYTDCSVFVATVMKKSGVDKDYPYYTENQLPYVLDHPEKFYAFHPTSTSQLKPGDILLVRNSAGDHHTMIYIGPQPGKPEYTGAEASASKRVPMLVKNGNTTWMLNRDNIYAVRMK